MSASARFIAPMLLLRTDSLPDSAQWLYELKLDGYRAMAFKRAGVVHLFSAAGCESRDGFEAPPCLLRDSLSGRRLCERVRPSSYPIAL